MGPGQQALLRSRSAGVSGGGVPCSNQYFSPTRCRTTVSSSLARKKPHSLRNRSISLFSDGMFPASFLLMGDVLLTTRISQVMLSFFPGVISRDAAVA